jgi:hypothetical protein
MRAIHAMAIVAASVALIGLGSGVCAARTVVSSSNAYQRGNGAGNSLQEAQNKLDNAADNQQAYNLGYRAGLTRGKKDGQQPFNSAGTGPGYGD